MKNILAAVFLGTILIGISACSNYRADVAASAKKSKPNEQKFHGDAMATPVKDPIKLGVETLKQNKLNGYSQKSIGEAFDAYNKVVMKEWQEEVIKDEKLYVDYICWFDGKSFLQAVRKDGVLRTGLDVKFVIHNNGDTYIALASKLLMKNDGKVQAEVIPFQEIPKIVDAIYNNKELIF